MVTRPSCKNSPKIVIIMLAKVKKNSNLIQNYVQNLE